jgi:hypothetical protein
MRYAVLLFRGKLLTYFGKCEHCNTDHPFLLNTVFFYSYSYIFCTMHNVACLLKARIVKPEKEPSLSNGCVTRKNGVNVGSGVLCAVRADSYCSFYILWDILMEYSKAKLESNGDKLFRMANAEQSSLKRISVTWIIVLFIRSWIECCTIGLLLPYILNLINIRCVVRCTRACSALSDECEIPDKMSICYVGIAW